MLLPKVEFEEIQISRGYTHLGFGALRRVNGLGLVKLRFLVTLRDALHSKRLPSGSNIIRYEFTDPTNWQKKYRAT